MAWNPQQTTPGTNWQGNQPVATLRQLNSTIGIISTVSNYNFRYTSTVSNTLSTNTGLSFSTVNALINGLILSTGGTTATWSAFPALQNVDMAGYSLNNARFLSTLDLQCSSINGLDIGLFNSTITLQGVTITNNSIVTQNITQQKSVFEQVVGGINAVASAVSEVNTAVGGFLSNTFGVVQQVYYGARAVGAVVDLTTSVVQLATAGQALADSRTINTLSGNNVGTAVFETFNHTSQLQFSTLMSTTLTYYRTTTAANPNLFYGREIIISSYISAGTKCLRSIGDPLHMPIASTQLLSTTNFIQSFGQWSPILATDNNLNLNTASVSSLTVSSIYGNWFSTGSAFISSINGQPISAFINSGDVTFNSISTTRLSTNFVNLITFNQSNISNVGQLQANSAIFSNVISVQNNGSFGTITTGSIVTTTANVTTTLTANSANINLTLTAGSATVTNLVQAGGFYTTGTATLAYVNVANTANISNLNVSNTIATCNINASNIINVSNLTVSNVLTTLTISNSGNVASDSISTNYLSTAASFISSINGININSFGNSSTTLPFLSTTSISAATASISSIYADFLSSPVTFISSINGININSFGGSSTTLPFLSTNSISSATAQISSIFTNNVSTAIGNISSLSIYGNLVFLTAAKGYDISKTLTSTVTNYDKVSSLTQDIFGYQMNLTTTGQPESFDMGGFFTVADNNNVLWSKKQITYSGVLVSGQTGTINIVPGNFTTSDFFDVKNIATNGAILNIWNPFISGGLLLQMLPGTYYRFTYSGTAWTFAANPTPTGASYSNIFAISQGWDQTTISTGNILNLVAGEVSIPGFTSMDKTNINYLIAGGATFSTIVSPYVSSSAFFTSSINGSNLNTIFNTNVLPFLSTTSISTATIKASTITGLLYYNLVSTVATSAGIDGTNTQILNSLISISSPIPLLNLTQSFTFSDSNYSYWNNNGFQATGDATTWFCTIQNLVTNTTGQVDIYIGYGVTVQINYPGGQTLIGDFSTGFPSKARFTFAAGAWTFTNTFTSGTTTNFNGLQISQDISKTLIQTTDSLVVSTSLFQVLGDTFFQNLASQNFNTSTLSSVNVYSGNIKALGISTNALSTNSITTNSLTTNSFTLNGPLTVPSISTTSISTSLIFASTLTASTRVITPSISTLKFLNGFNTRLLNNPGNVKVYTNTVNFPSGSQCIDINTDPFVPGVYTCSAVCRGNALRTLEATLYYTSRTTLFCENAQGFDNYNGQWWHAYNPGFVRFTSQTDGQGDTFDIFIYMISGQYTVIGDDPPFPQASSITAILSSINTGTDAPIVIGLSSLTGSTITVRATENLALIAGLSTPTFLGGVGTVAINASTNVDVMANYDVTIGAAHDINATGTSNIRLTSPYIKLDRTGGGNLILDTNVDLNCANGRFLTLGNSGGGSYFQIQSGGAQVLTAPAGQSITLGAPSVNLTGNLNMNNNNINNLSNLNFSAYGTGVLTVDYLNQPSYSGSNGGVFGSIPFIQYGESNMRSNVASNIVTLPIAYQDTSYVVQVTLNSNAALSNLFLSAVVLTSNTFAVCQNTTIGSEIRHYYFWTTIGSFPTGVPP